MDDLPDVWIGQPWRTQGSVRQGNTLLFASGDIAAEKGNDACLFPVDAIAQFGGESAYDWAGWSVDVIGDINQDGEADLLTGAFGSDRNGNLGGAAYVLLSSY